MQLTVSREVTPRIRTPGRRERNCDKQDAAHQPPRNEPPRITIQRKSTRANARDDPLEQQCRHEYTWEDAKQRCSCKCSPPQRVVATSNHRDPEDRQHQPVLAQKSATNPPVATRVVCSPPDGRNTTSAPAECPRDASPHQSEQQRVEEGNERDPCVGYRDRVGDPTARDPPYGRCVVAVVALCVGPTLLTKCIAKPRHVMFELGPARGFEVARACFGFRKRGLRRTDCVGGQVSNRSSARMWNGFVLGICNRCTRVEALIAEFLLVLRTHVVVKLFPGMNRAVEVKRKQIPPAHRGNNAQREKQTIAQHAIRITSTRATQREATSEQSRRSKCNTELDRVDSLL